ncbi:hypothetical protein FRACYDRAFT_237154 [Fragilariopsis cylindrus CCMP1102]|uniref:DRBM domain-containing protein n=1 Tax=Fragilariopsis cylindrus CCMP1102 TaxID=635003 RepID=A0A1E7FL27_9STRA|nr:hypothetical protein FRACYDRAFT_237154 [Fragilariopsis cylindrus CCMP1102]|eukprot:OEU18872.1 hypothetical protein FRACYDRAFT_237154 [Fragilariopsis cylindrus CCMP1102]
MLDQTLAVDNDSVPPIVASTPSVDNLYNDADQHRMNFQQQQQHQQMQQQMQPPMLQQPFWSPPPLPPQHSPSSGGVIINGNCNPALLQFYEAQMRDHAAAYASAAAAAAMTAAQIATDLASTVLAAGGPNHQHQHHHHHHHHQYPMIPSPTLVYPQHLMQNSVSTYGSSATTPTQSRPLQQSGDNNNNTNFDVDDGNDDRICHHPDEDEDENRSSQQKRGRRRRRFWNSAGSNDSGNNNSNNDDNYNRNRRRNRKIAMTASSSSDGGSASCITKKKQRQPNDESLLGKTGVSALYEWCGKRRTAPIFTDIKMEEGKRRRLEFDDNLFEMTISIDGVEMGIGVGITKASAKHEASRRTLQVLLPGVQFDEDSGILIRLPGTVTTTKSQPERRRTSKGSSLIGTITSLEELAPNLAKQLAIGHNNDDDMKKKSETKKERNISGLSEVQDSRKRHKWPHVYPGTTSTTSDDEDENSYYASRGASVCSSLLHAMVQIDERLTEPPEYTYQVSTITNEREGEGEHSKLKRKAGIPINDSSTVFPRGSFECTGILKLRIDNTETDETDVDSFDGSSNTTQPRECYQVLRSYGVGGTKREARHTAAAKLLAMLFPDCVGMADVKQAAEAAREKYAASRAFKQQQSKRGGGMSNATNNRSPTNNPDDNDVAPNFLFESLSKSNTIEIPDSIKICILSSLGDLTNSVSSGCDNNINTNNIVASKEAGLVRQLSRQQQLEERIDVALQTLNEHDEEGRSLPEELTVDDVGRTVLRKASGDDEYWVEKLFGTKKSSHADDFADLSLSSVTISASDKEPSSTIVLLLCRAFHEDPPLGCAVLTLGFSMQKGKILRIAQIASYSHQPKERFIETLSEFAKYMGCYLISSPPKSSYTTLRKDCIQQILNPPHLESLRQPLPLKEEEEVHLRHKMNRDDSAELPPPLDETFVSKTCLQPVEEEVEGVEESDSSTPNNDKQEKRREKPSKRSRFE